MNAKKQEIVNRLAEMERENRRLQALLTDSVSLTEYRPLADGDDWTRALSAALREHEIVRIPAGEYLLSGGVVIPSGFAACFATVPGPFSGCGSYGTGSANLPGL